MPSPSSWPAAAAPAPTFTSSSAYRRNGGIEDLQNTDELISPNLSYCNPVNGIKGMGSSSSSSSASGGGSYLFDEFQLQDQLSFLDEATTGSPNSMHSFRSLTNGPKNCDFFYPEIGSRSPTNSSSSSDGMLFPYGNWSVPAKGHRRSCSVTDLCLGSDPDGFGFGWKPCVYFARGYCKNGTSCRFLHGLPYSLSTSDAAIGSAATFGSGIGSTGKLDVVDQCQELLGSKRLMASASFPYTAAGKYMNFLLQQQNDSQRAAMEAALMLGGDGLHKFGTRSMIDRSEFASIGGGTVNSGSRQIYLTFPADSTFREEDVSNYFSIYGPVQDVRIPYQQKRMFGFVTFLYPETVKLILAKGNPHFVRDARVLVKPYKEKGQIPDKKQPQQQAERGDFSSCTTPSSLDSRDASNLQLGARMFYNSQEMLLRKLDEQADLQQAIEMQGRRLMGLQLLDVMKGNTSPLPSPSPSPSDHFSHQSIPASWSKSVAPEDCNFGPSAGHQLQLIHDPFGQADKEKESTVNGFTVSTTNEEKLKEDTNFQESGGLEHNLPDNPFASPTKSAGDAFSIFSDASSINHNLSTSSLLPVTSNLDMASFRSCLFQMPRFSSSHEAKGLQGTNVGVHTRREY